MDICYAPILDNKIVLANNEVSNLFGAENSEIVNSNIYIYIYIYFFFFLMKNIQRVYIKNLEE